MPDAVARLEARLSELAGAPVELDRPNDPGHGDYATNVAMRLAPVQRRSPRELGEELAAKAAELDEVERAEVAGPGFVNLWLAPSWFGGALGEILEAGREFGGGSAERPEKVQVEMVSANPTGPITVASARNGAFGDSVARLLEFAGHEVEREYYYNDAGTQMEKFRASVEARRRGDEPPEDGYQGAYIDELAASDEDPVPKML
ncbi:MAG: arginine--tRNA ligase, partial [Gaiellaceae bacterium]